MKETTFRFDLRITSDAPAAVLEGLKDGILAIKGVQSVESETTAYSTSIAVCVCFDDAKTAKRLHRNVMNEIVACESVAITQASTVLTDIF